MGESIGATAELTTERLLSQTEIRKFPGRNGRPYLISWPIRTILWKAFDSRHTPLSMKGPRHSACSPIESDLLVAGFAAPAEDRTRLTLGVFPRQTKHRFSCCDVCTQEYDPESDSRTTVSLHGSLFSGRPDGSRGTNKLDRILL